MLRHADLSMLAGGSLPAADTDSEIVLTRPIPFHSLCEQHLLPFYGVVHVGYVPDETQLGTSELARIVEACARGIQIQQRMTSRIGLWLHHQLAPRGVGVLVEAVHICMPPSRVSAVGTQTLTTAYYGSFFENARARREFLTLTSREQTSTQEENR
ncbi:GTP cyclohydrolase I [Mycobacterium sp. 1164966.3]|uniref:GTP cyclohydrolase I n=1 Tax=Mycobacterium sp. 1164966.3 TaxID=1856861 RepID=UPI0009ECE108|nr:GTP cyclohydrolase I [Mycobacterium sp. 1164966.3]